MNAETTPASIANEAKNDNDFVKSGDEEEEIPNRKLESNQTVRVVEQSKENLLVLLDNFSEDQLDRYEAYRRAALNKTVIRRFISSILNQPATTEMALVVAGFGKVFIGEIVELAKDVMEERGDQGPLAPVHLREAYRRYKNRSGCVPSTAYRRRRFR
ncbi:transcription initiation factor TFIID subunit 11 [Dispira simplex]|nr:transcription initiation factor TFIID subunit 11 [Dispira simplex]